MFAVSAFLPLAVPASAHAALVIDIGDHVLAANTANQTIAITVAGTQQIQGLNFHLRLDSDTTTPSAAPRITGLDITGPGTVFFGINNGQADTALGEIDPVGNPGVQFAIASTTTTTPPDFFTPNGTLAWVTFDTTGLFAGQYTIVLNDAATDITSFGGISATDFLNGSLSIEATAIPEPTTFAVLAIAAVQVFRRTRRNGKNATVPSF